jgi:cell division protein FtsW
MKAILKRHPDKMLMASSLILMMLGLVVIYSSSGPFCRFLDPPRPTWYFLMRQSAWAVAAVVCMLIAYRLNYHVIIKLSPIFIGLALLALLAVLIISSGQIKRWLYFGGFTFQPSEFFKLAFVAFMARVAAKNARSEFSLRRYAILMAVFAVGAALIIKEPDLGTTALVTGVAAFMLFLTDFPKRYIAVVGASFAVVASSLVFGLGYEIDRVQQYGTTLYDPFDSLASYQTRQSLVSLGSGGLLGKGLGNGGQKHLFLPERHTDFILSAAAEEGGFIFVMAILAFYALIALSGYSIAKTAIDIEGAFLVWGILLFIMLQAIINISVAMGLFPVKGMTLPFLSYGGSSLLICSLGIGLIASVARQSRSPRHYFMRLRT